MDSNPTPLFDPAANGWKQHAASGFMAYVVDQWQSEIDGSLSLGTFCEPRHSNVNGYMHGGLIATLLDQGMGAVVRHSRKLVSGEGTFPTIQMDIQFLTGAKIGDFVHTECQLVRETRTLTFATGRLLSNDGIIASASAVFKFVRPHSA